MLDIIPEISILYDFYGVLLPPKQREIFRLYYEDNLSLGEIAEEYGLTRQGIHETIKRGEKKLRDFEKKLGLIRKFKQEKQIIDEMKENIRQLIQMRKEDVQLISELKELVKEMDQLVQ
ncbi:MAG: YlxM family DNA-binding protein [Anaerovoracaceae bacterium]